MGIGARATAAGPAQGFIYKRSLQSKFLSILTLLPPVVVPPAPPQPSSPSLSRVLSVWSFVILAETLSTGEQNFLLLFPMPVQPLAQSQKHSRCLSKRPWRGRGGENARGRAPAAFCYCLPSKERGDEAPQHRHGRSLPSPRSLLLAHQPHNGAISKISPAGLSQGRSPPPTPSLFSADPGCRRTTWRGRDPLFNRRFVSSQQLLLFFFLPSPLVALTFAQKAAPTLA